MDFDFIAIAAVVGTLLPLVISLFKQLSWSNQVKKYFAMGLSIVAAVIMVGATEGWDSLTWSNLIASAGVIVALAQTTYAGFWEDTKVEEKLESVLNI